MVSGESRRNGDELGETARKIATELLEDGERLGLCYM